MPHPHLGVTPYFDMELFMRNAQENQIHGPDLDRFLTMWSDWLPFLRIHQIAASGLNILAVWLDEAVEKAVDDAWRESPARGFRLNALAQTLCMCAVYEQIPEIEDAGCAPSPQFSEALGGELRRAGLPCAQDSLVPGRRYAVVTPYPFKGGCEICALSGNCPRRNADSGFSVVFPGYER